VGRGLNTPPRLDQGEIVAALAAGWGFRGAVVEYAALGFGSHHWIATDAGGARCFVTVDDLSNAGDSGFARLTAAFQTARRLRDDGLEFVVAPLPDGRGDVVRRLNVRFSIAVFPYIEGVSGRFGAYAAEQQRRDVRGLIDLLHGATGVVEDIALREDFSVAARRSLEHALTELDRPWDSGPFAEPARLLLVEIEEDLQAAFATYDELVELASADPTPWVITHGEPHAGNVIWTDDGPRLVDWDTALIAPAARDLWAVAGPSADPGFALYRLRWDLTEIALYVSEFRRPHDRTADTVVSWRGLQHSADQCQAFVQSESK
jgi:spectinomycin phosphotransferase